MRWALGCMTLSRTVRWGGPTSGKFRCFQNCNFRNASQNGYWYPRRANGGGALPAVMTTTVFENRNCDV